MIRFTTSFPPLMGGARPHHQSPRPRSIPLHFGFIPSHSIRLMEPINLHHLLGTQTPARSIVFSDYITRDHLVTHRLLFRSRMLCSWLLDTCRYTWLHLYSALVPLTHPLAYITPLPNDPCPLASRDGELLIREQDLTPKPLLYSVPEKVWKPDFANASHRSQPFDQYIRRPIRIGLTPQATRVVGFGNIIFFIPFNYSSL